MQGKFMPRFPYFILRVEAPEARARSWCPRQIPKMGTLVVARALDRLLMVSLAIEGSPGPLETKRPS